MIGTRVQAAPAVRLRLGLVLAAACLAALVGGLTLSALATRLAPQALRAIAQGLVSLGRTPAHVDAVAIHGGGDPAGHRELPAVRLLEAGRTDWIVAMGGPLPLGDPDLTYSGAIVRRLGAFKVDIDRILPMAAGLSTYDELRTLRRLAEAHGWHHLALSTSPWHTRRVALAATRVFAGSSIDWTVIAEPADNVDMDAWWTSDLGRTTILGEWVKIGLFLLPSRSGGDGRVRIRTGG